MGKKRDRESLGGDAAVPGGDPTSSMFTEVRANVSLKLLPERISDVDAAVRKELSGMLLRLDPHLGGVPVTFSKVKILETTAPLFEDHPQILIDVAADFLLFAPQPGQTVTGVVNNVADDSLGLLILETFNAVIPLDQLSKSFRYDAGAAAWVHCEDAEQRLELGLVLDFRCSEIKTADRVIQVMGKLRKGKVPRRMAAVPAQPPALPAGAEEEGGGGGARAGGEGVVAVTPDRGSKWHGEDKSSKKKRKKKEGSEAVG